MAQPSGAARGGAVPAVAPGGESPEEVPDQAPPASPPGALATLGISFLVALVFVVLQAAAFLPLVAAEAARTGEAPAAAAARLEWNGLVLALCSLASAPPASALLLLLVKRRRLPVLGYLGLDWPGRRRVAVWLLLFGATIAAFEWSSWLAGRPLVPPFLIEALRTARYPQLLVLALVVVGPAFEELLFRGFLLQGLGRALGPLPAIAVSALAWTAAHTQYDAFWLAQIFLAGLFLGYARTRTGSTTLPFLLHATLNLVATLEAASQL